MRWKFGAPSDEQIVLLRPEQLPEPGRPVSRPRTNPSPSSTATAGPPSTLMVTVRARSTVVRAAGTWVPA
ncbi:hypothetical protein, partial [Streptomyces sp. NPDC057253]|uniref:hypothetical protein n=1 Tax=Streptomyces sp. NPDC057253 TaxID=3346069 RepID=UPI00363AAA1E